MFWFTLIFSLALASGEGDTLWIEKSKWNPNDNFNFYKLIIKTEKGKKIQNYMGFDSELLISEKKIKEKVNPRVSFFQKDSLLYSYNLQTDTSFVALITMAKPPKQTDTIRISEKPKVKRIEYSQSYYAYKLLNPIKITISGLPKDIIKDKLEGMVFIFYNKKLLAFFKASHILIYDKQQKEKK